MFIYVSVNGYYTIHINMAKWSTGSETGILRKPVAKDKFDDLLVFGYACKIFRDDEKALYIDQGKHLIPWMGDNTLRIDRYDCRGALSELRPYESADASRWLGMSDSERRIELLCDEERYYALKYNEEELEMYEEEESKRLQQKGTEFQYNYDVPRNPDEPEEIATVAEQDEAFTPLPELNIPADMEVPQTVKENARIEKTAMFVSNQGPQMEILIKTKQADNPQFHFMNKDSPLYKYYKHVLTAIKSGQYKIPSETTTTDQNLDDTNEQEDNEGHYLHPSLLTPSVQPAQPPPPPLPTVIYKPSADCAYSQLVSRIQGTQSESATPPPAPPLPTQEAPQSQMTYEQQQYYQQYYYAAQYYEYYKQVTQPFSGQNADQVQSNALQEAGLTQEQFYAICQKQMELQTILQSHAAYQQYVQEQPPNPYAQLVSNLSQSQSTPALPSLPNLNDISKAPILYTNTTDAETTTAPVIGPQLPPVTQEPESQNNTKDENTVAKMPLLSLAQYGSDTEDESEEAEEDVVKKPPSELQQIIDKMAVYVSKNGKDFENIVKAKDDTRFQFLQVGHEYNPYYNKKIEEASGNNTIQENGTTEKPKEKKIIAPVSFSIKKPKDDIPKEIKSALPIEESDDEHDIATTACSSTTTTVTIAKTSPPLTISVSTPPLIPENNISQPNNNNSLTPPLKETEMPPVVPQISPQQENNNNEEILPVDIPVNSEKPIETDELLEMIDITENLEELRENKRVENIKKDKITAALRERLALQLERKKKAAAFLKLKSNVSKSDLKAQKLISKLIPTGKIKQTKSNQDAEQKLKKTTGEIDTKTEEPKIIKQPIIECEIISIEDSDLEEGEIKKHKKSSKKKKSHKRKRSKSRHESKKCRHRHKSKEHKKSKKRRKKSEVSDSDSSVSSS